MLKTQKQTFYGIVPGFGGRFCLCVFLSLTLSFLSLVVWISLVNFKQGNSLLKLEFSL